MRTSTNSPFTISEIIQAAPSVFASSASSERSERYSYVPTSAIVDMMQKEGFGVFEAVEAKARKEEKKGYTKHLLRFRHESCFNVSSGMVKLGELYPEIVLINSHDGSSCYTVHVGLFRQVCINGLVLGNIIESEKIKHKGDIISNVIDASYRVMNSAKETLETAGCWSSINLTKEEQLALAESAHYLKFSDSEGNIKTSIKPKQLLLPRRSSDISTDLWTTYNVIQENVIKGGLPGVVFNKKTQTRRRVRTREVKGIDENTKLNIALSKLMSKMAEIKG